MQYKTTIQKPVYLLPRFLQFINHEAKSYSYFAYHRQFI